MSSTRLLIQISAATQGDRNAFTELVTHYQGLVSATTLSITGDFQRSEDLAQETFLIAWSKLPELKEPLKFPGWLCGIARNCANNWLRRTGTDPLALAVSLESVAAAPSQTDPVETIAVKEETQLVWNSLAEIAPLYREPLIMFYRQGAEIAEIAAALEITEETVRQRLSRGRKLLKTEVEKTIERTLTATRPDAAFTLAVLAAIPLSATVGCTGGITQSVGLFGSGAASFGNGGAFGTFLVVLSILGLFLLYSISTVLLAAACLYGFWIAIKRSPTLQTKRLMISAALDVNLIVYALPMIFVVLFRTVLFLGAFLYETYCRFYLIPCPTQTCERISRQINTVYIADLPVFLLLAGLVLYAVYRWQKLLYEEMSNAGQRGASPAANGNAFLRLRDYFRTDAGLRFKRNFSIPLVLLVSGGFPVWQCWFIYTHFRFPSFTVNIFQFGSVAWFFALAAAIQIVFFKLVSCGITLAEIEAKSETVDFGGWTVEDVSLEKRRKFVRSSLFLLAMIPVLLFVLSIGVHTAYSLRTVLWDWESLNPYTFSVPVNILFRTICVGTVLAVLAAFWGTLKPHLRNRIYAALFFAVGTWVFVTVEWEPLMSCEPVRNFLYGWMDKGKSDIEIARMANYSFFYHHLLAGTCLAIYMALAAWFGLQRRGNTKPQK